MYQAIASRVAAGQPYHAALATEMPARGYAVRPIFNWRMPTLAWLNGFSPSPVWGKAALWAIGTLVIVLWTAALRVHIPGAMVAGAVVMALATAAVLQVQQVVHLHEVWAGLLIAASLGSWALRRVGLAIALGLLAMLIRELALPYVLMMALLAWRDSNRRETFAWAGAAAVFLACWAWHISFVLANMPAEGLRNAWIVAGGWPFVLTATRCSVFLMFLPAWTIAIVVPIVWAGFWHWNNSAGRRVFAIITAYFVMFMVIGRADNWYWGFLVAPLIPIGILGFFFKPSRSRS